MLQLKDNGRFCNEIRQVVMKLHSLNPSSRSICPAIKTVLEGLTNLIVDALPSYGTVNKMMYEAKCLALLNAGRDSLKDKEHLEPANFLMSDGTSKLKKHYNTTIISTSTGIRTIGLQLLPAENSETLMKVTRESFEEVASILERVDGKSKDEYLNDLMLSLKGTMSDRCEVMKKFNRLFEEYRDSVLEAGLLAEEEKNRWQKLQNHFCFLHIIINLGDDACKNGLVHFDKCTLTEEALSLLNRRAQSSTYSAIYTAARLLHQQGSEVFGKSGLFEAFLMDGECDDDGSCGDEVDFQLGTSRKGTQVLTKKSGFEKEVGNRAHITFINGAALWFGRKKIKEFLEILMSDGSAGEVIKSLDTLMKSKVPLTGAGALGIVHACVTGPSQAAFDKVCENILDMIPYCIQMQAALQEFSENAQDLFNHPRSVLPGIEMHKTQYTAELFAETGDPELDGLTILAIQLILKHHLIIFERQAKMYLTGGEFAENGDRSAVRNCPLTNRPCESNMGRLDKEITMRPNATPGYIEAKVVVTTESMTNIDQLSDKTFDVARKYANECIADNKRKLKEYIAAEKAIIKRKQEVKQSKDVRVIVSKSKVISDISKYGGEWKCSDDVENNLKILKTDGEKKRAIECQIRYYKVVLETNKIIPKEKKSLFVIKDNSLTDLKEHIIEIINLSPHYEHLADLDDDEVHITGMTMLDSTEREQLIQSWIEILQEKLQKQRQSFTEMDNEPVADVVSNEGPSPPKRNRRSRKEEVELPDPVDLVGKRVEHCYSN